MLSDLSIKKNSRPIGIESTPHLLLIRPSLSNGNDIEGILLAQGYAVSCVDSIKKSKLILANNSVALILLDMDVMTEAGPQLVHEFCDVDCVILVNEQQAYLAAEAMRAGAIDYI